MKKKHLLTAIAALMMPLAPAVAATTPVQLEGVRFTPTLEIGDTRLTIQGTGLLRYMVVFKAYVGALYLADAADSKNVLTSIPKRLELEYFHAIDKEDFAKATRIKIADNISPEQSRQLASRIDRLADLYESVEPGDRYALTHLPGRGTELSLNGRPLGIVEGEDFARAIFAVWLGQDPIDEGFREALLGNS